MRNISNIISGDMAEKAKNLRTYARGRFTRAVNALLIKLEGEREVEVLQLMVNDVEKAWEDVEGKHQNYVA